MKVNPMTKMKLRLPLSLMLLTAASLAVAVGLLLIQPNTGVKIWPLIADSYGSLFLLNWLPVWLMMLALFFAVGNLVAACGIAGLFFILLSVVNRYMIAMRWSPLRPFDLLLGAEFLGIAKSIRPVVFIVLGVGIIVFTLLFVVCLRAVKNDRLRWPLRLAGFCACVAVMAAINFTVYNNTRINAYLPHQGSLYNETDQFQSKGFVYSFLYALNTSHITRPSYYDLHKKTVENAEHEAETRLADTSSLENGRVRPNIIMILSEAFTDIPLNPALQFDEDHDPLPHYKAVKEESLSGYIVAPHIGGGTSDTEFDILTGLNTRDFRGVPYAFSMITRPFPGFTAVLKSVGYDALGLHPGAGWFYNRQNVYPLLGFDAFLDDRTYDTGDTKGLYITERQTVARILDEYRQHQKSFPQTPFFLACMTIQNHGPYNGKYNAPIHFTTELPFTGDETQALADYFEGLSDCDEGLWQLVEYFKTVEEPTLLVYYGDHLPSFSPSMLQSLVPEQPDGEALIRYNRTPFLLWANDTARGQLDFAALERSLPEDRTISAHYLGAAVLELIGLKEIDPMMDLLNELRPSYPVVLEKTYRGTDGVMRVFDPEAAPALALYRSWAYYRATQ